MVIHRSCCLASESLFNWVIIRLGSLVRFRYPLDYLVGFLILGSCHLPNKALYVSLAATWVLPLHITYMLEGCGYFIKQQTVWIFFYVLAFIKLASFVFHSVWISILACLQRVLSLTSIQALCVCGKVHATCYLSLKDSQVMLKHPVYNIHQKQLSMKNQPRHIYQLLLIRKM